MQAESESQTILFRGRATRLDGPTSPEPSPVLSATDRSLAYVITSQPAPTSSSGLTSLGNCAVRFKRLSSSVDIKDTHRGLLSLKLL